MNQDESFGRVALESATVDDFLVLEQQYGSGDQFAWIDDLVEKAIRSLLEWHAGRPPWKSFRGEPDPSTVVDHALRNRVDGFFGLRSQQSRGAWFLTEGLGEFSDGVLRWAIIDPLYEGITRPFVLRDLPAGSKSREWQIQEWSKAEQFLEDIGFHLSHQLAPLRYGGGWSKLRASEKTEAKEELARAIQFQAANLRAANYRVLRLRQLLARYYKMSRSGPAKMRRVLNPEFQRVISGYFGGDWLRFLEYIGEPPHEDERLSTVLPNPYIRILDTSRIAVIASELSLSPEQMEGVLSAVRGQDSPMSFIEPRVETLKRFWTEWDGILSQHESSNTTLLGQRSWFEEKTEFVPYQSFRHPMYDRSLSDGLLSTIDQLWGTVMLPRRPEAVLSALSSHDLMLSAIGPAIQFWNGCVYMAWSFCEGPYTPADLSTIARPGNSNLQTLAQMGCAVGDDLHLELVDAERLLGPPQRIYEEAGKETLNGITITMQYDRGFRRDGYEILRDILTRHRRAWAAKFLDSYLASRWQSDVGLAAREYYLLVERKGRPPTAREFAKPAETVTNAWFGGHLRWPKLLESRFL